MTAAGAPIPGHSAIENPAAPSTGTVLAIGTGKTPGTAGTEMRVDYGAATARCSAERAAMPCALTPKPGSENRDF